MATNGDSWRLIAACNRLLARFFVHPRTYRLPVKFLSGGGRNRVLLARLFAKPANVIVLDEPTNDLDTETLELLEDRLVEIAGTILVVSHDRKFLNNVVTSTIVFEEDGVREYLGGCDDWLRQRKTKVRPAGEPTVFRLPGRNIASAAESLRKLTFKERRELETLPAVIENFETKIALLRRQMAEPQFYQRPGRRFPPSNSA